ncbi:hypothetical protein H0H93_007116 [Arthromyces matolae]|nr:hypothetical protein H0H93_007116 [Arthromyces matolae]
MLCRERRSWTAKEDQLLRDAVAREDPDNANPSKWHAISKHVPNRTNKDCRKRWFAKMASDVVKGGWAPDEDEKLVKGIEKYGTRWSLVASIVGTRNSDQCAKRWTDTLNPAIDRTTWTPDSDEVLLQAVNEHGKVWTKIVKTYFPGRTGLSAKNRYNSITRFNADRGPRSRRRTPDLASYHSHRKSGSVSSSSSSVSPSTPSLSISDMPHSPFSSAIDSVPESYLFDSLSNWAPAPEPNEVGGGGIPFFSSSNVFNIKEEVNPTPLLSLPPHPFENFSDDQHLLYGPAHSTSTSSSSRDIFRNNSGEHSTTDGLGLYSTMPTEAYNSYSQYPPPAPPHTSGYTNSDLSNQMALLDSFHPQGNQQMQWGSNSNFGPGRNERSKLLNSPQIKVIYTFSKFQLLARLTERKTPVEHQPGSGSLFNRRIRHNDSEAR